MPSVEGVEEGAAGGMLAAGVVEVVVGALELPGVGARTRGWFFDAAGSLEAMAEMKLADFL